MACCDGVLLPRTGLHSLPSLMMSSLFLDGAEVSLQLRELGSFLGIVLPATLHHFVHFVRAPLRTRHPVI